jgi:hypothetical protein
MISKLNGCNWLSRTEVIAIVWTSSGVVVVVVVVVAVIQL